MDIEVTIEMDNFGRGRSRSRDRKCSGNFRRNDRSSSSRVKIWFESSVLAYIGLDVLNVWEYDHFAKDCPNSQTEREP